MLDFPEFCVRQDMFFDNTLSLFVSQSFSPFLSMDGKNETGRNKIKAHYSESSKFRDTPHRLKPSGFCSVAHADIFSSLRTSYAGMRRKPYACGGCHGRNNVRDTKLLTILVPDVHCSYHIPMSLPLAVCVDTGKVASLGSTFAPFSTAGTGFASVAFLLQHHFFFSSRRRHTRLTCDLSSDVCSSDLGGMAAYALTHAGADVIVLEAGGPWDNMKDSAMLIWPYESPRRGASTKQRPF